MTFEPALSILFFHFFLFHTSEGSDGELTTDLHFSSANAPSSSNNHLKDPPELDKVLPSLVDVKAVTKPSKDADLPVDVLLLTVTNCEFLACYSECYIVHVNNPTCYHTIYFLFIFPSSCFWF